VRGKGAGKLSKAWPRGFFIRLRSYKRDWYLRQFPLVPMCQFSQLHALPCRNQTRVQLKTATSASRFANDTKGRRSARSWAQLIALKQRSCCSAHSCRHKPPKNSPCTHAIPPAYYSLAPLRSRLYTFAFVPYSPLSTTPPPHTLVTPLPCLIATYGAMGFFRRAVGALTAVSLFTQNAFVAEAVELDLTQPCTPFAAVLAIRGHRKSSLTCAIKLTIST